MVPPVVEMTASYPPPGDWMPVSLNWSGTPGARRPVEQARELEALRDRPAAADQVLEQGDDRAVRGVGDVDRLVGEPVG